MLEVESADDIGGGEDFESIELSDDACRTLDRLYDLAESGTLYELLGVGQEAERKAVQQAFYELSRQWHPDRFFRKNLGEYEERLESVFIAISEAYKVLSDDARRTAYDFELKNRAPRKEANRESNPVAAVGDARARRLERERTAQQAPKVPSAQADRARARPRPRPRPRGAGMSKAMADMRAQMIDQLRRARQCYLEGKAEFEAGNIIKASAALHLATRFDPDNAEYAALNAEVTRQARKVQARAFIVQAESAESFQNPREAMAHYRKAIEYEPSDGMPYFRLGMLVKRYEDDTRSALSYLREAVRLQPGKADFRMGLGDLYAELGLNLNARREYQAVLDMDKTHAGAREALKKVR